MNTTHNQPIEVGTNVEFNIAEGMTVGRGVVRAVRREKDEDSVAGVGGFLYQVEPTSGGPVDVHRNVDGELWVWDFEVRPIAAEGCEFCRQHYNRPWGEFTCPYCHRAWANA